MATSHVDEFTASARAVDAAVSETTATEFAETLSSVVRSPAIGTPLDVDGLSYADTPVEPDPTSADLLTAETGVTAGQLAIADYGSVVLEESGAGEELLGLYPALHVVVVRASDVVPDMTSAFDALEEPLTVERKGDIIATGPSATADMGAVVTGVHGPHEVHVVVVTDR